MLPGTTGRTGGLRKASPPAALVARQAEKGSRIVLEACSAADPVRGAVCGELKVLLQVGEGRLRLQVHVVDRGVTLAVKKPGTQESASPKPQTVNEMHWGTARHALSICENSYGWANVARWQVSQLGVADGAVRDAGGEPVRKLVVP